MDTRKLGKPTDQRLAMLSNLATDILWYGHIETTFDRAKAAARVVEKVITLAVNTYEDDSIGYLYYIIQVKDNKFTLRHKLTHLSGYYKGVGDVRGTYIGDSFFTVSDYLVKKFDFGTGEFEAQVTFGDMQELTPTTAAAENKDIYEIEPGGAVETTVGTSQGYTVDEPITKDDTGVTGQTTPPYNPDNPDEVIEMPTE